MAHDVFISYASEDKDFAFAACRAMEEAGYRCWIAPRDVRLGDEYGEAIVHAIEAARVVLLLLSESSNASPMVERELEIAASADREILPCRVRDVEPSKKLRFYLAGKQWMDAFAGSREEHLRTLVGGVRGLIGAPEAKESVRPRPQVPAASVGGRPSPVIPPGEGRAYRRRRRMAAGVLVATMAAVMAGAIALTSRMSASKNGGVLVEVIGPEAMDLCGSDEIQVKVTNRTRRPVKGLVIEWPSLSSAMSLGTDDAVLLKNETVSMLSPGETRSLRRWLVVRDPGRYPFGSGRWTVTGSAGEPLKGAEIKVTPSEIRVGQPKAWIGWDERPNSVEVGEECKVVVKFENSSDIPSADGQVRLQFPSADVAIGSTEPRATVDGSNVVTWTLGRIEKGGPQLFTVRFKALQPGTVTIRGTGRVTCATEVAKLEGEVEVRGGQEPVALLDPSLPVESYLQVQGSQSRGYVSDGMVISCPFWLVNDESSAMSQVHTTVQFDTSFLRYVRTTDGAGVEIPDVTIVRLGTIMLPMVETLPARSRRRYILEFNGLKRGGTRVQVMAETPAWPKKIVGEPEVMIE